MQNKIIYEQPLNERVRNFLRLEHLFSLVESRLDHTSSWDFRSLLETMLEITDLLSRSDLKTELIKELERHSTMLTSLRGNPAVDQKRLDSINDNLLTILKQLRENDFQPGSNLKNSELVNSFKQRTTIPGGTCSFDLPRFHHWLNLPITKKRQDMHYWFEDIQPINHAVKLSLEMLRNSTNPSRETAQEGFYQRPIESNLSCQLIRVLLSEVSEFYPEISGGKHRFTVRFMKSDNSTARPIQTETDVEFELHCCIL